MQLPFMAVALLCIASGIAYAAETDRLDTLTIVVTGDEESKLPLAVSRVESEDLAAPNEQSLQDFLDPVPGLFSQNQDNTAQGLRPSIRGFGSRAAFGVRGIRVLVDGVPMTLPDGQTDLDALDLGLLESVEVIRGPSATLFGNAAGGAILLETREPAANPEARLDLQAGNFGNRRLRLEGSHQLGGSNILGAYTQADADAARDHAHTDTELLNLRLTQSLANGKLSAWISRLDITSEDPGGLTESEVRLDRRAARDRNVQFNAGETIEQQRAALSWNGSVKNWSLQTTGYAGQREFANRLPFAGGGQVQFDRSFAGFGATVSRTFEGTTVRQQFSMGLDMQLQKDDRERFDNNNGMRGARTLAQDEEASSAGFFIRDTIALTDHWETSLGLRHDMLNLEVDDRFLSDGDESGDRDIDNTSADISLSRYFDQTMVYGRLATSFETPTFTELANPNGGGFNPELESTEALNREIGIKGQWSILEYTAAIYSIKVDDELVPFELASQPGRRFFRNAGKTQRKGIELTGLYLLTDRWQINSNYSYADNEFENGALSGNQLPGLPEHTVWLSSNHKLGNWNLALSGQYIGRLYADDSNTESVEGYGLVHAQSRYRHGEHIEFSAAIDNLLDKKYNDNIRINAFGGRYFEPAAGRTYRLNLKLKF